MAAAAGSLSRSSAGALSGLQPLLEELLQLKDAAVRREDFDEAHRLKLAFEVKRREKERYVQELRGYEQQIRDVAQANGKLVERKRLAVGLEEAVRQMKALVQNPRRDPLFGSTSS